VSDLQQSADPAEDPGESQDLTEFEQEDLLAAEESIAPVTYSGQDFDVAGIVRRFNSDDILIPTFGHDDARIVAEGFQRAFVWNRPQMDRFIESLLMGYPVPGIFLVRQTDRRYLVLDGHQRIRTLAAYYRGIDNKGREFSLKNVSENFRGLTYDKLDEERRRLLDDTFIQATIVPTDGSSESLEAIYQIFERVNAGGTPLTAHEIRVALFAGPFIDYLEQLNNNADWRALYGKKSPRIRDQELVLRIVALDVNDENYHRPLKTYLNGFVSNHRNLAGFDSANVRVRFERAAELLNDSVGRNGLRFAGYQINAALADAIFVGLMRRLSFDPGIGVADVESAVGRLRQDDSLITAVSRATADEENVRVRLELATTEFAEA
jgi:hypothetical protein